MDEQQSILSLITTTDQQDSFINLIENMLENIFKKTPSPDEEVAHSPFLKNASSNINLVLTKNNIISDRNSTQKFLESLLENSKTLPIIKITIAFAPSDEIVSKLKDWSNKNISGNIIFEITTDPKILAGSILINSEGEYVNYSLSEKLDKFFLNKKQEILSLL